MRKKSIISDVQLTYKASEYPSVQITSSEDAVPICYQCIPNEEIGLREFFGLLLLNRANRVIGRTVLFSGGLTTTVAEPRHVLQCALLANAAGIIVFHNHPSGQLDPSSSDLALTRQIKSGCDIFNIKFLDHIILSGYPELTPDYFSFANEGLLEEC